MRRSRSAGCSGSAGRQFGLGDQRTRRFAGFLLAPVTVGIARALLLTGLIATLALVNILGIRQSASIRQHGDHREAGPLAGLHRGRHFLDRRGSGDTEFTLASSNLSSTALLLVFAFGGYEVVPVVAGEARDPRREIPFALIVTILLVIPLLAITQVIAMSTLPGSRLQDAPGRRCPFV